MQKTIYYKVVKVNAGIKPELFTIRRLGDKDPDPQLYYANQLVKTILTPQSNLKFTKKDHRTVRGVKKTLLKFRGIKKEEWINDAAFKRQRVLS